MARRVYARTAREVEFEELPKRRGFIGKPTLIVFWVFVVVACLAFAIPAIPEYQALKKLESELEEVKLQEEELRKKGEQAAAESRALTKNPRYLEARARDALRRQLPGETVIQIE